MIALVTGSEWSVLDWFYGKEETCTALVLSGGGNNGAWEAGVLWGLAHYGDTEQFQYDVVTGVSAGGINAASMAVFEKGDELQATEWLSDMWNQKKNSDFYVSWMGGIAEGLLFKQSLYDTSPQLETVKASMA